MKKILYLALHLGFGGVEKSIINQANILCEFCKVEIVSAYKLYERPPFVLDSRVSVQYLMNSKPNKEEFKQALKEKNIFHIFKEGLRSLKILVKRTSLMKRIIKQCDADIIISSRFLYNKLLAKNCPSGTVAIAQEHCHHNGNKAYISKLINSVSNMDYFMPVSQELTDFYSLRLAKYGVKCVYLPHNLDYWPESVSSLSNKIILSVGRLSYEKGFADLIDVFSFIAKKHPDWTLHIIGDGPERKRIQNKIQAYQLEKKIILHGYQEKAIVNKMMSESSIYIMGSLEESFGIVLIEAQSNGLPCVAFDSAQGASEIITNAVDGYLVPNRDKEKFVNVVEQLINNEQQRTAIGAQARISAQRYKQEIVANMWYLFIESIKIERK